MNSFRGAKERSPEVDLGPFILGYATGVRSRRKQEDRGLRGRAYASRMQCYTPGIGVNVKNGMGVASSMAILFQVNFKDKNVSTKH